MAEITAGASSRLSITEKQKAVPQLLDVRHLCVSFGPLRAVDDVSFSMGRGETLCIVGESGCGKSVTALSIIRQIGGRVGSIDRGEIFFDGHGDLLKLSEKEMCNIRGNEISMIFQEPMTSLNPLFRVGNQIAETLRRHRRVNQREALERAVNLLRLVGIPAPENRVRDYPHQFSGGMRQRAMIAMAIACEPRLVLADEPTTALDVTIQAQILDLLNDLKAKLGSSILLITHDLGCVAEMADYVCTMYAGTIVEQADVKALFADPLHPYTRGLLASMPRAVEGRKRLYTIPGMVPSLANLPVGCRFQDRCNEVHDRCRINEPPFFERADGHRVRCWLYDQQKVGAGSNLSAANP